MHDPHAPTFVSARRLRGIRNKKRRQAATRRIVFEPLETRALLAADISITPADVSITFDDPRDVITIRQMPGNVLQLDATTTPDIQFALPSNSLTLNMGGGKITVAAPVTLAGPLSITNANEVNLAAGVNVTAASLTFTASNSITVNDGVSLNASGDITLKVDAGFDFRWENFVPQFKDLGSSASIRIGDATLSGANVLITADTDTSKQANFEVDTTRLQEVSESLPAALPFGATVEYLDSGGTANDVIKRNDGLSWQADSGFRVGDFVRIANSAANDGIYKISALSADRLTIETAALTPGVDDENTTIEEVIVMQGSPALTFMDGGANPDTITRSGARTWTDDGFQVNQTILVTGTPDGSDEDTLGDNDNTYLISAISPDGKTITVEAGSALVAQANVANVTVTAQGNPNNIPMVVLDPSVAMKSGTILRFSHSSTGPDTIRRLDGRNWADFGFAVNQLIHVDRSERNNGAYHIAALNGSELTLRQGEALVNEDSPAADINALSVVEDVPNLTFNAAARTITRTDTAGFDWSTLGFAANQSVTIEGTPDGNQDGVGDNDHTFIISSVNGNVLTLAEGSQLVNGTAENINVTALAALTTDLVFSGRTITRRAGSWTADGFQVGNKISIDGSQFNNGIYRIESLSPTTITVASSNSPQFTGETTHFVDVVRASDTFIDSTGSTRPITSGDVHASLATVLGAGSAVFDTVFNLVGYGAQVVLSEAISQIEVGAGAEILAAGDVAIQSATKSVVEAANPGIVLGVTYGKSHATAKAIIADGARIQAGDQFTLHATVDNQLTSFAKIVTGLVPKLSATVGLIPGPSVSVAVGEGSSISEARLQSGSIVDAGSVDVAANNTNDFVVRSQAKVNGIKTPNLGEAISAGVSLMESTADAVIGGKVTSRGDVRVNAISVNDNNDTVAIGSVKQKPSGLAAPLANKAAKGTADKTDGAGNVTKKGRPGRDDLKPASDPGTFSVGAAMAFAESSNRATAKIIRDLSTEQDPTNAPENLVQALGSVLVTAFAEDNCKITGIGKSKAETTFAIGGAVAFSSYLNQAEALVGENAIVDAYDQLIVQSQAQIPNQVEVVDKFRELIDQIVDFEIDPTFDYRDPQATFSSLVGPFANVFKAARQFLPNKVLRNFLTTSYTEASAGQKKSGDKTPKGTSVAVSGNVNILRADNRAEATIDDRAQINQRLADVAPSQSVLVDATTRVEMVNVAGFNLSGLSGAKGNVGIGGTYQELDIANSVKAHIDDAAKVRALRNISVTATNTNAFVNLVAAGGSAIKLGVAGVFSLYELDNTVLAYIENGAMINADRNILVDATNRVLGINVGGAIESAGLSVGVAVALNDYKSNTRAFIGNLAGPAGAAGTVSAKGSLTVDANSNERLFSVSVAGAFSGEKEEPPPGEDASAADTLEVDEDNPKASSGTAKAAKAKTKSGLGLSGSVGINDLDSTTQAFVSDLASLTVGGDLAIRADNEAFLLAISGAVAFDKGSDVGGVAIAGSFSSNELKRNVRAYTSNVAITAANVTVAADNRDKIIAVSAGGGGAKKQGTAAIIGSVNLHELDSDTQAFLGDGTRLTSSGDVSVAAESIVDLISVAGGLAFSGKFGFGAAVDISLLDAIVKASIAPTAVVVADGDISVTANANEDVLSIGASLAAATEKLGISGSGSSQNLDVTVEASVSGTVTTNENLVVDANDTADLIVIGGGIAFGKQAGIGLAFANSNLDRKVKSLIGDNATITARGNGSAISAPGGRLSGNGILVEATADDELKLIAAGAGVAADSAGIAASVVVNTMTSEVEALVGVAARINLDQTGAANTQSVHLSADHDLDVLSVAGSFAGSKNAGLGAAVDVELIDRTIRATIADGSQIQAKNSIIVDADSSERFLAVAAGAAGGSKAGLIGSVAVLDVDTTTQASIGDGAILTADGNVKVAANSHTNIDFIAGNLSFGGKAGIGVSNATVVRQDTVEAWIGDSSVTGLGLRDSISVLTGEGTSTESLKGVSVTATSILDLLPIAGAGTAGGTAGIAGSAVVSLLTDITRAFIKPGAEINQANGNTAAGADQSVNVRASDRVELLAVGGALGGAGNTGVGAGADVGEIKNTTEAWIGHGATVSARGNVIVRAQVVQDIFSIAASLAGGGNVGIAGSAGVYLLTNSTRAFIGDDPADQTVPTNGSFTTVVANGSVVVAADDNTKLDIIAGNLAGGAGAAGLGASAAVLVADKTTEAFLGGDARVTGRGAGGGVIVNTGEFDVRQVEDRGTDSIPDVSPDASPFSVLRGTDRDVTSPGQLLGIDAIIDLDQDGTAELVLDPDRLTKRREAVAATRTNFSGVAITAISQNDIETIGVTGGGSAGFAVNIGGAVNIIDVTTRAFVAGGARVNPETDTTDGTQANQSVLLAAGHDMHHMGIAGALSGAGGNAITPGADVTIINNTTQAIIADGAMVKADRDVEVTAKSKLDLLSVGAGVAGGGGIGIGVSAAVFKTTNTTQAYIGKDATNIAQGAVVDAEGNVVVSAIDETETLSVGGSLGGGGGVSAGGGAGVMLIDKDTQAFVGRFATVDARANGGTVTATTDMADDGTIHTVSDARGLIVQARSTEDLFTIGAAASGGGGVGLAGGVAVHLLDSNTLAYLGDRARINLATVNEHAMQDVYVTAANDLDVFSLGGALAGSGAVAVAGGVDVGIVRNDTDAHIADNAVVQSRRDVHVAALTNRDIESYAMSLGGSATAALSASVSVWTLGSSGAFSSTYQAGSISETLLTPEMLAKTLSNQSDQQAGREGNPMTGFSSNLSAYSRRDPGNKSVPDNTQLLGQRTASAGTRLLASLSTGFLESGLAAQPTRGTTAFIGSGAQISAGGDVDVIAEEHIYLRAITGAGAISGVGAIGASVAVVKFQGNIEAYVANNAALSAGGDVVVRAELDDRLNGKAFGGGAGVVGALGAQVIVFTDNIDVYSHVDAATLSAAKNVFVEALANRDHDFVAGGGAIGGIAGIGASVSVANIGGATEAEIGSANIGQNDPNDRRVENVRVTATSVASADTMAVAVGGGVLAGLSASVSIADIESEVTATIGPDAKVFTSKDVHVGATGSFYGEAETPNVTIAAGIAGESYAEVEMNPAIHATVGDRVTIIADGKVTVSTDLARSETDVESLGIGGGVAGSSGADSKHNLVVDVAATVGDRATILGRNGIDVTSRAKTNLVGKARVEVGGGLSLQKVDTNESIKTTTRTVLGNNASLTSSQGNVNIKSNSSLDVKSEAKTRFYGLGSGALANAKTTITGLSDSKLVETVLGTGSTVEGLQVNVSSMLDGLRVDSDADGQQFVAAGTIGTLSIVNVSGVASVIQQAGAKLRGDQVNLLAQQSTIDIHGLGDQSKGFGAAPLHAGAVVTNVSLLSHVVVAETAEIAGNAIDVRAKGATGNVVNDKNNDAVGIPVSKVDLAMRVDSNAAVDVAGKFIPGTNVARLLIDATGKVVLNQSFDGPNLATGTTITTPDVTIDGLRPAQAPSLRITAERSQLTVSSNEDAVALGTMTEDLKNTQGEAVTIRNPASYSVPDRFAAVTIENRSEKNLDINGIDVLLAGTTITPVISPAATLPNGGTIKITDVAVTIVSSRDTGTPNIFLDGAINNPTGLTTIHTAAGSVLDRNGESATRIVTATLDIQAGLDIGQAGTPVQADVSQEVNGSPAPTFKGEAGGSVAVSFSSTTPAQTLNVLGISGETGNVSVDFANKPIRIAGAISSSDSGAITISNVAGISDKHDDGRDISGGTLVLRGGTGDVGSAANLLETALSNVEIFTSGGIFLDNNLALVIGGVSDLVGLNAGGAISVITSMSLTVGENMQAAGNVRLTARDAADPNANKITLADNVQVTSTAGNIALLSGDSISLKAGHKLSAKNGDGEVVIGIDWGNLDPGIGGSFTVPDKASNVIHASTLRIIGDSDNDTLMIPQLFLPKGTTAASSIVFEGRSGVDSVAATLLEAPSEQTRLFNIDVETIDFQHVSTQPTSWMLDTEPSTRTILLFEQPDLIANVAHLSSGTNRIVQNVHSLDASFQSLDVDYVLGDGVDTLSVLAMRHPARLELRGGGDLITVGGNRGTGETAVPIDPGFVLQRMTIDGGSGQDTFVLNEPRTGNNVVPIGRIGSTTDGRGLIQDYGSREAADSPRRIEFAGFEQATVNLGETASIFTLFDTVIPTTINSGAGDDVVIVRKLSSPTSVNLEAGNDTLNIQGGGAPLTVNGGSLEETPPDLPDGGDRVLVGATRSFNSTVVNVADGKNAIKLFGTGWERGQQVLFTSDGTAPSGLTSGTIYYVVPSGRDIIRLAETRDKALAASPTNENDPNIIVLGNGGAGEHHLTLTTDGKPLWPSMVVSLTGTDASPSLSVTQPAAERKIATIDPATNRITTETNHRLADGQQVAVFSDDALPGGLRSEKFYFVINPDATSFQLSETAGGTTFDMTAAAGTGSHFIVPVGTAGFTNFEKANVLLGLGNDTFIADSTIQTLSVEVRGGPGNDEFVLLNVPGKATVISGDSGAQDQVRVLVPGNPRPDQFTGLTIGAGIENLAVDNSTNANAVAWIVSQGSLHFLSGDAAITADASADTFAFSVAEFDITRGTSPPLQNGDLVLVQSSGALPTYILPSIAGTPAATVPLDTTQFYAVREVGVGTFKLSLPGVNAALNLDTSGTGTLFFKRVSALISLEGAKNSELLAGGDNTATLSVVTPLDATVDVNANQLRIIEGARVLDHQSNLSRQVFPVDRVDGLQGVRSVVTTSSHFVFAAGTTENKIAMFVREVDPTDPAKSLLKFVKAIDSATGRVPNDPSVLKLSPDERFLYAIGSSYFSAFAVLNVNGKPDLQWVQDVLGTGDGRVISYSPEAPDGTLLAQSVNLSLTLENPTDLEFSRSSGIFDSDQGTRVYVTDAGTQDGIVVFRRDAGTGSLTEVIQKLTKENSFGKSVDVGNAPTNRPNSARLSDGNLIVLDEPFTQPINGRGTYTFHAWNASTITPVLLRPLTEDDHTDPESWDRWEIVATGATRTTAAAGVHEFEFGLASGNVVNQSGLYFGWIDGGVGDSTAVLVTPTTSSNAFQIRSTELTIGVQAGSRSSSAQYRPGFAFSMDAKFEVEMVKGLEDPQTIAISPDGKQLFTGDRVGNIATWAQQADGTFRVQAHQAWYPEGSVAGGPGYGRAVDLSHDSTRNLRLSELSAYVSLANAGQTIFGADSVNRWIAAFDTTTNNLRYAPVLLPQSTFGVRGPFTNTLFDIDADAASAATNGQFLLVGAPGSDRVRSTDANDQGDDVGAVLSYRINFDQTLTLHQIFSWTTEPFSGSRFGSNIAMDGNRAAIPLVDNLGSEFVQIVEYDPLGDVWAAQATLSGGFLVDMDRDTLVTSAMGIAGPGVQFYQRINGTWTPTGFFNLNPIAVTIDGNTASVTVEGAVYILRQNEAGEWGVVQQLSSPASTRSQTSISEGPTAPLYSSGTLVNFFIQAGTESDGNGREELYITRGFNNTTDPVVFNPGAIGFNERETHTIDGFASFNGSLVYSFWEFDGNSGDEFFGRIRFNENGSVDKQSSESQPFVPCDSPVLCVLKDKWEVRVAVSSQSIPDSDTIDVTNDLADSLGDRIAVGLPTQTTVAQFAESERQAGWFQGNGRITDIAVSPDGSTLYATDVTGTVFVLYQETPPDPQNPDSLRLDPLQPPLTPPSVTNLAGASSIAISADGAKVYVTAETSGAVTVFDRGGLFLPNALGNRTAIANDGGNLTGVADSATEAPFNVQGGPQQFLVTASAGSSTLATFEFKGSQFIASQRNNPNGRNGLGDGDPLDSVTRVQGLAMNPFDSTVAGVKQVFYAAAPFEDTIFVFNRAADGATKVAQRLKDDRPGSSGQVDSSLAGAADIAVSPDGKFIYVAAVEEGSTGTISVYERAMLMDDSGVAFDGLRYVNSAAASVFGAIDDNAVITLRVSPDGKNIYASGASGLQVFDRNTNDGSLTTSVGTLPMTVSDIKFPAETRAYSVEPFANKLLIFDRAPNGALTKAAELDTRLDNPRSVEIGDVLEGQNLVGQRFVYVASAGTNSISVFDEFSSDGSDSAIDGKLRHVQLVREGVSGVRGLSGVSVLQLSAYVNDSTLEFAASELDLTASTVNTNLPHGLRTEQLVWFTEAADAPGGVQTQESALYYARRLDKDSFQLFTTPEAARSGDETKQVKFTAGDGSYALHTEIPAGAFLYALGSDANAIVVFERELDAASPNVGQLSFLQVIRNRVGNATGGANLGLFRPDSIVAPSSDSTTVFVSSSFDPLLKDAPGGFVTLHNNADDSPSLPPVETRLAFANISGLTISTGNGSDVIKVNKAPSNGMGTAAVAIPLDVSTGKGVDAFTLNDAGDQVLTSADLGAGDDVFTLRTQRDAAGANIQVRAGDGNDSILAEEVAARSTVMIWTEGPTNDPNNIWIDAVRVAARGIHQNGNVTVETGTADGDLFTYEVEGNEEDSQFINGDNANGNQLQLDWANENTIFGSVFAKVGSNDALPTETFFVRQQSAPVASIVNPEPITQGSSVTFESNSSLPVVAQTANTTVRTTYAWDLNGDGLFTEFVTENPAATFAWEDLIDFGFAAQGGGEYRVPLRVTRTFTTFDPAIDTVPRITQVQQSDTEVLVTVTDTPPVAVINNGQAEANHVVRLGGAPFALKLASDGNDPTNDAIVQWTVRWVEDEPSETIDAQRVATHFYQRPGRYEIVVTGLDENNKQTQRVTTAVNVTFDASSLDPGAAYAVDEGQGVELRGVAAGSPTSVRWFINGNDAGAGTLQPFRSQDQGVTGTLLLTWPELQALGITNDGSFDVQLRATYAGTDNPIESAIAKLVVANVAPQASFINSGPINQGEAATVGFVDVVEPHDQLSFSYDFGTGYQPGGAQQTVPTTLGPGMHVIAARLSDGTVIREFSTTVVINDLPPELTINASDDRLVAVSEGETATVQGTFHNPGGGAVVFSASIGTVSHDATVGRWTWTLATTDNTNRQPVTITVTDAENAADRVVFDLVVSNVSPIGVLEMPSGVKEGDAGVSVRLTQVTDPSSADTAAAFSYFYDFGDGKGFVAGSATQAVPAALLADSGVTEIRARIVDKDGGITEVNNTLTVANTIARIEALTITPQQINSAVPVTVTGQFGGDAGINDNHSVVIDWGDGRVDRLSTANVLGISAPGTGYIDAQGVPVTGGSGTGRTVDIATENGAIIDVVVKTPGIGYQPGDVLTVTRGTVVGDAKITLGAFDQTAGTFTAVHAYSVGAAGLRNPMIISVTVSDDDGGKDTRTLSADIIDAPVITSESAVTVEDRQIAVTDVQASDPHGETEGAGLTYHLSGGADQAQFSIVAATGVLTFKTAPLASNPTDAGQDNIYNVQVTVTNSAGLTGVQDLTVTVIASAVNEPPSITSTASVRVPENQTAVIDVESSDPDGETEGNGLTYSLSGGVDKARFAIDTATGRLSFITPPNFEAPQDVGADNAYELQITVSDAGGLTGVQNLLVTVTDIDEGQNRITLDTLAVDENLSGLVVGQLGVVDENPLISLQLSVDDSRFEIVDRSLKLKDGISLKLTDGATITVEITAKFSGVPPLELTEPFVINVVANPRPWQYRERPVDSNGDGNVVPLDVLRIINQLNNPTVLAAGGRLPVDRDATSTLPYYDVNGDGFCTPNDALRIINFLNDPQGEGEARAATERLSDAPGELVWFPLLQAVSDDGFLSARDADPSDDGSAFLISGDLLEGYANNRTAASDIEATLVADDDCWDELLDQLAGDVTSAWWNPEQQGWFDGMI